MIMLLTTCVGVAAMSDGASAASSTAEYTLTGDDHFATDVSKEFELKFTENTAYDTISISYTAVLQKDGNTVTSGVSPSSGSLTNAKATTLTVASQSSAGSYVLKVTITEEVTFTGDTESSTITYTVTKNLSIIQPITLSVTLENKGQIDLYKGTVVFYLDGKKIDGSETDVSVDAGESTTVTYDYVPYGLSNGTHTYYIVGENGTDISGIGADHKGTFYYNDGSYAYLDYIAAILVIIMVIAMIWVLRKPVKNRGKPKARKD